MLRWALRLGLILGVFGVGAASAQEQPHHVITLGGDAPSYFAQNWDQPLPRTLDLRAHCDEGTCGWEFTPEQAKQLQAAAAAYALKKFPLTITLVPGAPSDAFDAAYDLKDIFGAAGWRTVVEANYDAEYSPHNTGVVLTFQLGTKLDTDKQVAAFKAIFQAASIEPVLTVSKNVKRGLVKITVGRNP